MSLGTHQIFVKFYFEAVSRSPDSQSLFKCVWSSFDQFIKTSFKFIIMLGLASAYCLYYCSLSVQFLIFCSCVVYIYCMLCKLLYNIIQLWTYSVGPLKGKVPKSQVSQWHRLTFLYQIKGCKTLYTTNYNYKTKCIWRNDLELTLTLLWIG